MPSYILTGDAGAGKTAALRLLEASGYAVVEEAATDVHPGPEPLPGVPGVTAA